MYKGLEGLRAWLAWTVVLSHIAMVSGIAKMFPHGDIFSRSGDYSVRIFIIISGFVITHLIETKREPYRLYITRRLFRIFPAYAAGLVVAILTVPFSYQAVIDYQGSLVSEVNHATIWQEQLHGNFFAHLVSHLTLLHGIFPNNILPDSQYMFFAPAWSLSLEWQFYLLAPLWIIAFYRRTLLTIAACIALTAVYNHTMARYFYSPSFLPGACLLFLLGIATRMWLPKAPRLGSYPGAFVLGTFALLFIAPGMIVISIWIGMVCYLLQDKTSAALDSALARRAGERSYAVYIIHSPILLFALFAATKLLSLGSVPTIIFTFSTTIVATLVASEFLYRFIESPMIRLGRSFGQNGSTAEPSVEANV